MATRPRRGFVVSAALAVGVLAAMGAPATADAQVRHRGLREDGPLAAEHSRPAAALVAFNDCDEVRAWLAELVLDTIVQYRYSWWWYGPWAGGEADGTGPSDYSTTNTQEEGIDELDIVKSDGRFMYVTSDDALRIVRTWPAEDSALVATLPLEGYPYGLFVADDTAAVLTSFWDGVERPSSGTRLSVLDVGDRSRPAVRRTVELEGWLVGARMIGSDLWAVLWSPVPLPESAWELVWRDDLGLPEIDWDATPEEQAAAADEAREILRPLVDELMAKVDLDGELPWLRDRTAETETARPLLGCGDLFRPATEGHLAVLSVVHIDIAAPAGSPVTATGVLADGWTVYASQSHLYVAQSGWLWWWGWGENDMTTAIHRFTLEPDSPTPVRYTASGEVPGWLSNQFALSEYDGHLRVATTLADWWWGSGAPAADPGTIISVLADDGRGALTTVGQLRGIAPGEQLYATRFLGPRGFAVTFERIDPLFALDLSDPTDPRLVGELEVPGFASYLHPVGDDALLAVGLDGTPEGTVGGLAVTLFDVSDLAAPAERARYTIATPGGAWAWSEALADHHAFTYHRDVLSLPVYLWDEQGPFSGLLVLDVDAVAGTIGELGRVDHADLPPDPARTWDSMAWMRRGLTVEDALYSLSDRGFKVNRLTNPEEQLATVPFFH